MADAISIEQMNQIRIGMGLKPLSVPGAPAGPVFKAATSTVVEEEQASTLESRQAESYENYRKLQDAENKKKQREAKAESIKKARDAAKRFTQLEGKGLGAAEEGEDESARSWLKNKKKRGKEIEKARERQKREAEAEAEALTALQYTSKDLSGVRVAHEFEGFDDDAEQVLILKDTTIDENEEEGDELENVDLREREKLNDKLELKKKKPAYNPHDIDETGERSILSHYDVEIEGKKGKKFTLDGQGSTTEQQEAIARGATIKKMPTAISLDFIDEAPATSDYLDISEIKIRKPKKDKKKKSTRQKAVDEEDIFPEPNNAEVSGMDIDETSLPTAPKRTFEDMSFVDDDDLQASIAAQRRDALKKRKRMRPEDIAQQLREEAAKPEEEEEIKAGEVIIDETSEFVANLRSVVAAPKKSSRSESKADGAVPTIESDSDDDEDVDMDRSYADQEDEEDIKARHHLAAADEDLAATGIDEEATLETGVGATLKLLKDRGVIKTAESGDLNAIYRSKQLFLAEKQRRETAAELKARQQRERDRANGRLDRMSAKEKEEYARQQNNYRDQQESRQLAEHFNREYKPNVELKYIDEFGRNMNQKEAFKNLSHQFHGKGSGKLKTEKTLKKIEEEKRKESKNLLDASQSDGMSGAVGQQLKKQRQAGVRLA